MPLIWSVVAGWIGSAIGKWWASRTVAKGQEKAAQTQSWAAIRAAEIQAKSFTEALNYQKEQDRQARRDWEARERRITPYRQGGQQAIRTMASLMPGPQRPPPDMRTMNQWPRLGQRPQGGWGMSMLPAAFQAIRSSPEGRRRLEAMSTRRGPDGSGQLPPRSPMPLGMNPHRGPMSGGPVTRPLGRRRYYAR